MAVLVSDLVPRLAGRFPHIAEPILQESLLFGAYRFCYDTGVWRATIDTDVAADGATTVYLFPPMGARVVSLLHVKRGDRELALKGDEVLDEALYSSSKPSVAALVEIEDGEQGVAFDGPLSSGESLLVRGTLAPTLRARSIPDILFYEWFDGILAGAMVRLFRDPSHERASEQQALSYEMQYDAWVRKGRARARSGATHAQRAVKYGGI